jgi:hypothetical protein
LQFKNRSNSRRLPFALQEKAKGGSELGAASANSNDARLRKNIVPGPYMKLVLITVMITAVILIDKAPRPSGRQKDPGRQKYKANLYSQQES